jgi:hypothetical protein
MLERRERQGQGPMIGPEPTAPGFPRPLDLEKAKRTTGSLWFNSSTTSHHDVVEELNHEKSDRHGEKRDVVEYLGHEKSSGHVHDVLNDQRATRTRRTSHRNITFILSL